jgi:multiple sugar transport system permease protein
VKASREPFSPAAFAISAIHVLLGFFSLLTLIPFFWVVCSALKSKEDFFSSLFLPAGHGFLGVAWDRITLDNFRDLFTDLGAGRALLNSAFIASVSAIGATLFCAMGGYALAKFPFRSRFFLTNAVVVILIIPHALLLVPGYQLIYNLGLLDTYAGLLLPTMAPATGIFLFRQAMLNTVPTELIEAARIDGAGEIRIFFTLVLPLVRPMVGAFMMLSFLAGWNRFIEPQIILQNPDRFPLSVVLNNLRSIYGIDYGLITAGTLLSIAPVICLFLLLQKEFISGLTSGAVKG